MWATDITSIPVEGGFFYLVAIMDLYRRYVLAWELSNNMEIQFCHGALAGTLSQGKPEIFNSDRGSQFTSFQLTGRLLERKSKGKP